MSGVYNFHSNKISLTLWSKFYFAYFFFVFRVIRLGLCRKKREGGWQSLTPLVPLSTTTTPSPRQRKDDFCLIIRQFSAVNSFLFVRDWKSGCDRCETSWVFLNNFLRIWRTWKIEKQSLPVSGSGFRLCWRRTSTDDSRWVTFQRKGTSRTSPAQSGCSCLMFAPHVFSFFLPSFFSSFRYPRLPLSLFIRSLLARSVHPSISLWRVHNISTRNFRRFLGDALEFEDKAWGFSRVGSKVTILGRA